MNSHRWGVWQGWRAAGRGNSTENAHVRPVSTKRMRSGPGVPECGRNSVDVNCTTGATFTKGSPPVYVPSERVWMAVGILLEKIGNCGLDLNIVGLFEWNEELVWHESFCSGSARR